MCEESKPINKKTEKEIETELFEFEKNKDQSYKYLKIERKERENDKYLIEFLGNKDAPTYGIKFRFEFQVNDNYLSEYPRMTCLTPLHFPLITDRQRVIIFSLDSQNLSEDKRLFYDKETGITFLSKIVSSFSSNFLHIFRSDLVQFDLEKFEKERNHFFVDWKPEIHSYFGRQSALEIESLFLSFSFLKKFDDKKDGKTISLSSLPKNLVILIAIKIGYSSFV